MDFYNNQQQQPNQTNFQQQSPSNDNDQMQSDFEPISRPRSNTWPLNRPENQQETNPNNPYTPPPTLHEEEFGNSSANSGGGSGSIGCGLDYIGIGNSSGGASNSGLINSTPVPNLIPGANTSSKKVLTSTTSRRNAWGNLSYADLITQAIQSSPESRLTLSQIYDWMVSNIPYFKDKGDSNSSAGWKNSIRHNLSLHNRFMRVQNEGTGKSSWWILNPDAKPGKAARRRATSMETKSMEKKRGRIKKKLELIRNGIVLSPASSLNEGLDLFPEEGNALEQHGGNPYSPLTNSTSFTEFRQRTSSNASSIGAPSCSNNIGGRLSPVLDDSNLGGYYSGYFTPDRFSTDVLSTSLGNSSGIKLEPGGGQNSPVGGASSSFHHGNEFMHSHQNQMMLPFRSHSFGVGSGHSYQRPNLSHLHLHNQQQQHHLPSSLTNRPPPHSTSMDQLLFPNTTSSLFQMNSSSLQQQQQQNNSSLFADIKPNLSDLDFQLEQLEPSFTTLQVDEEVLRSEMLSGGGNEFLLGSGFGDDSPVDDRDGDGDGEDFMGQGGNNLSTNYIYNQSTQSLQQQQQSSSSSTIVPSSSHNLLFDQSRNLSGGGQSPSQQQTQSQQQQSQAARQWVH